MKTLLLFFFSLQLLLADGQGVIGDQKNGLIEAYDLSGKRIPLGDQREPEGNKMLNDQFVPGVVRFAGGKANYHLLINFSLLDNDLYFKKDSAVLAFINPVDSFSIPVKDHGVDKMMNFKRGYPAISSNNENVFYQVLVQGPKIQLLKYLYKVQEEHYKYGGGMEKEYVERIRMFVFDVATKTMSEISPSVKSLKKSLPGYTATIEKFAAENKLKNEENEIALVSIINADTSRGN